MKSPSEKKTARIKTAAGARRPVAAAGAHPFRHKLDVRQSEERYQALFERSLDCVYLNDFAGNFLDANQAALDLLGYRRKDIAGLNFASLLAEDQLPLAFQVTEEVVKTGRQLKPSEFRLRGKDGRQVFVETYSSLIYCDGKPFAILGIARDLTARKQAEEALKASERKFRQFFDTITDPFVSVNMAGEIQEFNAAYRKMLGYAGKELKRLSYQDLTPEKWHTFEAGIIKRQVLSRGYSEVYEKEYRRKNGVVFPVELRTLLIRDDQGKPSMMWAIVRDVTERKQAKEKLAAVDRALKTTSACNRALVRATNEQALLQEICRVIVKQGGYRMVWVGFPEADEKKSVRIVSSAGFEKGYLKQAKITWSADDERGRGPSGVAFRIGNIVVCNDFQTDPITGPWRKEAAARGYASSISLPLKHAGESFGLMMIYADQSNAFHEDERNLLAELADDLSFGLHALRVRQERQLAEAALRSSEERFRKLFYNHAAVKLVTDLHTGKIIDANEAAAEFYGWPVAQLKRMNIGQINTMGVEALKAVIKKEKLAKQYQFEFQHRLADGSLRDVTVFCNPIEIAGKTLLYSVIQDISQHKQALAALEQSETRFRQIAASIEDVLYGVGSESTEFNYVNPVFERMLGYTLDDVARMGGREKFLAEVIQDGKFEEQRAVFRQLQAAPTNAAPRWQAWWRCKDGSLKFIEDFWLPFYTKEGLQSTYGVLRDITERKRSEAIIQAALEFNQATIDALATHLCVLDEQGYILATNQAWKNFAKTGSATAKNNDVGGNYLAACDATVGPETSDARAFAAGIRAVIRGECDYFQLEYPCHSPTEKFWFMASVTRFSDPVPVRLVVTHENITERKRVEAALAESEWRFQDLLKNIPAVAVQSYGFDGTTHYWNHASEKLYGYTSEEAIGKNLLDLIIPPEMRVGVRQAIQQMVETGQPVPASELTLMRKDGSRVVVFSSHAVVQPGGRPPEMFCIDVDLTGRKQVEMALRVSEENYRKLFSTMLDGFAVHEIICDAAGQPVNYRFLSVNPAFERLTGLRAADVVGRTVSEVIPGTEPSWVERYGRVALTGEPLVFEEYSGPLKKYFEVSVFQSQPGQFATMFLDITQRKQAENDMRWKTAFFEALVNSSQDGILVADNQNKKIIQNQRMTDLWKFPPEIAGNPDDQLQYDYARGQTKNPVEFDDKTRRLIANADVNASDEIELKDGVVLERQTSVVMGKHGEKYGRLWSFRDITKSRLIEKSLTRLATAVEQAAETIVITDTNGTILYANPAFEQTSGYSRAEVIGQNPRLLKSGKQDGTFYRQMWETIQRGQVWSGHFINKRKDGTLYEEEATISAIRDKANKIINFVAVKRDVTHEVGLEGQLRQSQKMQAIGTLAGGIAHDFNNILNVIFGYCNLLQLDLAGKREQLEKLGQILKAGERAKDLVQQILTFSQQREQARQVIHVNSIIKETTKLLRASMPANIQIETELAADVPTVLADATQIYQVMMNLGTNAQHAMEGLASGRLTITLDSFQPDAAFLQTHPELRSIKYARLAVADTGCGMDARTLARIFEPFFTTKPIGKGTGLGLAVVHGIVEAHDGVIQVESQPGQGTVFHLYFPEQVQDMFLTGIPENLIPCGQGQQILMVDDEVALTGMYQRLLKALKYEGTVITSAHEAISLVRKNPAEFDLVITDLTMPEINGLEVARQIREIRGDLPVILATGFHGTVTHQQMQDAGICELVEKPISMSTLAKVLRGILGKI